MFSQRCSLRHFGAIRIAPSIRIVSPFSMQDKEAALALLATTILRSRTHFVAAQTDPDFDCLRDDPRFGELVERARTRFGTAAAPVAPDG